MAMDSLTGEHDHETVVVLARRGSQAQIRDIVARYEREIGQRVSLLHGTSPGAFAWGTVICQKDPAR